MKYQFRTAKQVIRDVREVSNGDMDFYEIMVEFDTDTKEYSYKNLKNMGDISERCYTAELAIYNNLAFPKLNEAYSVTEAEARVRFKQIKEVLDTVGARLQFSTNLINE